MQDDRTKLKKVKRRPIKKTRVYDLAKEHNCSCLTMVELLKNKGYAAKNHMSIVPANILRRLYSESELIEAINRITEKVQAEIVIDTLDPIMPKSSCSNCEVNSKKQKTLKKWQDISIWKTKEVKENEQIPLVDKRKDYNVNVEKIFDEAQDRTGRKDYSNYHG